MNMSLFVRSCSWLMMAALLCAGTTAAQQFTVIDLGKVPESSIAHGLNDHEQIAGSTGGAHGDNLTAFFWSGRAAHKIGRPQHSDYSEAFGVNNLGQVAGAANLQAGMRAFTWSGGQNLTLLAPIAGDSSSGANGINDSGVVAGFSSGPAGMAAVIWQNGAAQAIVPRSAGNNAAVAINNHGAAAGYAGNGAGQRGFIWNAAAGVNLLPPLPGDASSQAFAINQQDAAAGVSRDSSGATRAVFWDASGAHNLGILTGGTHSEAFSINASGWVVGSSGSGLGMRAFLWTPADGMRDLNTLIPADSNIILNSAEAINDAGEIAATGNLNHDLMNDREVNLDRENHSGVTRLFLLVPVPTIAGASAR